MENSIESRSMQRPTLAGLWLIAAIPAFLVIRYLLGLLWNVGNDFEDPVTLGLFSLAHFAAGYLWARSLSRRAGAVPLRTANVAAGAGFAFFVVGGLIMFEGVFDRFIDFLSVRGNVHLEFLTIFVSWTAAVAGGSGFLFGLGRRDWRLALKLLVLGFLTGAGLFLGTAFLFGLLGFRVGTPRPDGLPSMPIITVLSVWNTALVGSAVFGRVLVNTARSSQELT